MKFQSINQLIEYRNKIVTRLRSRQSKFGTKVSYYEIRLTEIDTKFPEFKGKGLILLNKRG